MPLGGATYLILSAQCKIKQACKGQDRVSVGLLRTTAAGGAEVGAGGAVLDWPIS
jgi:hypothetical protein